MDQNQKSQAKLLNIDNLRALLKPTTEVSDELKCQSCKLLPIDAQECIECNSLFCNECVANSQRCASKGCVLKLKQPHRLVKAELNKISCSCINTSCKAEIQYEYIFKHFAECQHRITKCGNKCPWSGVLKDLNQHQQQCAYLKEQICEICKITLKMADMQSHNCFAQIKSQLTSLSEKYQDFKESIENDIKVLKVKEVNEEKERKTREETLKNLMNEQQKQRESISKITKNHEEMAELVNKQKELINLLISKSKQELIPCGELSKNFTYRCQIGHPVYFWMKSQGSKNTCQKCSRDAPCRYVDPACKLFWCLKCIPPELQVNEAQRSFACPVSHVMKRAEDKICSVCEKDTKNMLDPNTIYCDQCDFNICTACLKSNKFKAK